MSLSLLLFILSLVTLSLGDPNPFPSALPLPEANPIPFAKPVPQLGSIQFNSILLLRELTVLNTFVAALNHLNIELYLVCLSGVKSWPCISGTHDLINKRPSSDEEFRESVCRSIEAQVSAMTVSSFLFINQAILADCLRVQACSDMLQ
jgi:hypothetical protein